MLRGRRSLSTGVCCGTTRSNSRPVVAAHQNARLTMTSRNGQTKTPIRMLIADVDGTLVTQEKVLTKRAADAALRLHDARVEFSVTGGRPPRGMAMLIARLKLTQPLAAFNGGVLIKPDLATVVDQKFLPEGVPEKVIEAIENHGLDVWVYTDTA